MLTWQNTGDPCTPETVTFVNHLMPTRIGFTTALGPVAFTANNTAITMAANTGYSPRGLAYFDSSGNQQFLFSLANQIYKYPNNTNVSRGAAYTNGNFSFAQWRDKTYAANGADDLQVATTGSFADAAGTTPVFTRIAVAGEFLAGIGLAADFVGTLRTVTASPYMLMISGVGNPEQFDVDVDTSAYFQDIYDSGGPLTAIARLRNFFVVFQKSGVYVVENVGGAEKWSVRCVTDYYGCENPDSIIEVNNVLYWISPTRFGEVCAFDGAQVTAISGALQSTYIDRFTAYANDAGFNAPSASWLAGALTAATDGENIIWNKAVFNNATPLSALSYQLYMNIPTQRFGISFSCKSTNCMMLVASNAAQNGIISLLPTSLTPGSSAYKVAYLAPLYGTGEAFVEFFRKPIGTKAAINNMTLLFSETLTAPPNVTPLYVAVGALATGGAYSKPSVSGTPVLQWTSSQASGLVENKTETGALTIPTGSWNASTSSFNISSASARSASAAGFGFVLYVEPVNSLVGVTIDHAPSGTGQTGSKAGIWQ